MRQEVASDACRVTRAEWREEEKNNAETQRTQRFAEAATVGTRQKLSTVAYGVSGLAVAGGLFGYLEAANYAAMNPLFRAIAIVLCPPSLLSLLFFDAEPHTVDIAIVWLFIGLVNAGLYMFVGKLVRKL